MSTKIYNTFRIKGSNLDDTLGKIYNIKNIIKDNILDCNNIKIFHETTYQYYKILYNIIMENDNLDDEKDKKNMSAFSKIIDKYQEYSEDKNDYFNDKKTLNSYFIFIPKKVKIDNEDYYLGFYNLDFEKMIVNLKEYKDLKFEEYDYWDNTDKPDILTNYEWSERKRIWDEVFENDINSNDIGIKIPIVDKNKCEFLFFRGKDKVIELYEDLYNSKLPEYKEVAIKEFTENIKYKSCFNRIKEEFEKTEGIELAKEQSTSVFMQLDRLIRNVIKENQFTEEEIKFQECKINELKKLSEDISMESLFLKPSEIEQKYKSKKTNNKISR